MASDFYFNAGMNADITRGHPRFNNNVKMNVKIRMKFEICG
jgi:hypothetical protein